MNTNTLEVSIYEDIENNISTTKVIQKINSIRVPYYVSTHSIFPMIPHVENTIIHVNAQEVDHHNHNPEYVINSNEIFYKSIKEIYAAFYSLLMNLPIVICNSYFIIDGAKCNFKIGSGSINVMDYLLISTILLTINYLLNIYFIFVLHITYQCEKDENETYNNNENKMCHFFKICYKIVLVVWEIIGCTVIFHQRVSNLSLNCISVYHYAAIIVKINLVWDILHLVYLLFCFTPFKI